MRLSGDPEDPGYNPELITKVQKVLFNGVSIGSCDPLDMPVLTADEEAGYVDRYVWDPEIGGIKQDGDKPALERQYGRVLICWEGRFP